MVAKVAASPDPTDDTFEDLSPPEMALPHISPSDSEDDELHSGYEAIPQDGFENNSSDYDSCEGASGSDSESDDTTESEECNNPRQVRAACLSALKVPNLPVLNGSQNPELNELWNTSSHNRKEEIFMDSAKEEQIKNAMAGFQLPPTAFPPWAAYIPEEQWKEELKKRAVVFKD